jgi:hypothetical protein
MQREMYYENLLRRTHGIFVRFQDGRAQKLIEAARSDAVTQTEAPDQDRTLEETSTCDGVNSQSLRIPIMEEGMKRIEEATGEIRRCLEGRSASKKTRNQRRKERPLTAKAEVRADAGAEAACMAEAPSWCKRSMLLNPTATAV